ncbi:hypothetical protein BGY98DRAFT_1015984, partial [Russula aff. rugulosa BPL654]
MSSGSYRGHLGRPAHPPPGKRCHLSCGLEAGADDVGTPCPNGIYEGALAVLSED